MWAGPGQCQEVHAIVREGGNVAEGKGIVTTEGQEARQLVSVALLVAVAAFRSRRLVALVPPPSTIQQPNYCWGGG